MSRADRRQGPGGFTFVELLVVLSILAVCAATVFPKLDRLLLRESEPWKSGRSFVRTARYAHEVAIVRESMLCLHVDVETGKYWVSGKDGGAESDLAALFSGFKGQLGDGVFVSDLTLSQGTVASQEIVTIRFSPDGWSDSGIVTLTSEEGLSVTAEIGEWFGDVELASPHSAG